jgi:hypothetical protein
MLSAPRPNSQATLGYARGMPTWRWLCSRHVDAAQRLRMERNWRLGVRTAKRPRLVYADLHAAFLALGVLWKRTAAVRMCTASRAVQRGLGCAGYYASGLQNFSD